MKLDQFYTSDEQARKCLDLVMPFVMSDSVWLEPSAGTGAFFNLMPERKFGYDLEPKSPDIIEGDFLTVDLAHLEDEDVVTVGNPPFGKNASLAVQFFNRCAEHSQVAAFIVPRTFRKPSVINRLDKYFHLAHDHTLDDFSFIADGLPYDVPCCFQIWTRKGEVRPRIETRLTHPDFTFCKRADAEFAVQRVGVRAGTVKDISDGFKDPSHYFIRTHVPDVRAYLEQIDYEGVKHETAGNPSISKGELIDLYQRARYPMPDQ